MFVEWSMSNDIYKIFIEFLEIKVENFKVIIIFGVCSFYIFVLIYLFFVFDLKF